MNCYELWGGVAWFAIFLVTLCVLVRVLPDRSPVSIAMAAVLLFSAASLPLAALLPSNLGANYWEAMTVFAFLVVACLMVFGAVYKSISLRLLLELSGSPMLRLEAASLLQRYVQGESFGRRVRVMVDQGLAIETGSAVSLTGAGYRIAAVAHTLQRLYRIEVSG